MRLARAVKEYEKAHNSYDVAASMAMFAENAVIELAEQETIANLEAIRALHEYDKGIQAQIHFLNPVVAGLTVTCEATEQNQWLVAAGLGEIFYPSAAFTFNDTGKIEKMVATISAEDGAAMAAVLAAFVPWLVANRPEESRRLLTPDGRFLYSEANGILVVELLAQWRAQR